MLSHSKRSENLLLKGINLFGVARYQRLRAAFHHGVIAQMLRFVSHTQELRGRSSTSTPQETAWLGGTTRSERSCGLLVEDRWFITRASRFRRSGS